MGGRLCVFSGEATNMRCSASVQAPISGVGEARLIQTRGGFFGDFAVFVFLGEVGGG